MYPAVKSVYQPSNGISSFVGTGKLPKAFPLSTSLTFSPTCPPFGSKVIVYGLKSSSFVSSYSNSISGFIWEISSSSVGNLSIFWSYSIRNRNESLLPASITSFKVISLPSLCVRLYFM